MSNRPLPIGHQDFKELRDGNYLYVDKSDMISQIVKDRAKVYLYTRPRRFGKSLNLSMLDAFFNIQYSKDNTWFEGLKVSDCIECRDHKNSYPVICFDFKDIGSDNSDGFTKDILSKVADVYRDHSYLLNSDRIDVFDKNYIKGILSKTLGLPDIRRSLLDLSRMLYQHHGKEVVVLIDEYDNPINNSFGKKSYEESLQFIRVMLSSVMKGNRYLAFGVITGVMQISKESIFSGLNNIKVNNIFSKDFDEVFGFTDDDVRSILSEYGHPESYDEVRAWYDGYIFGDVDIFNPWSLLNYIDNGFTPGTYWAGTSGNSIIESLLECASPQLYDELQILSNGGSIRKKVNPAITFDDLRNGKDSIYSMMVMSGYLSAVPSGNGYDLSLPNGEMHVVFGDTIGSYLDRNVADGSFNSWITTLSDALMGNDPSTIRDVLHDLFTESTGSLMLSSENIYRTYLLGVMMPLRGTYSLSAEFENGNGRYDIMLRSNIPRFPNIIIEIKRSTSKSSLQSDAETALLQIEDRNYVHGLSGKTILYGISFFGKEPCVVSDVLPSPQTSSL